MAVFSLWKPTCLDSVLRSLVFGGSFPSLVSDCYLCFFFWLSVWVSYFSIVACLQIGFNLDRSIFLTSLYCLVQFPHRCLIPPLRQTIQPYTAQEIVCILPRLLYYVFFLPMFFVPILTMSSPTVDLSVAEYRYHCPSCCNTVTCTKQMQATYLGKLEKGRPKGFVCVRIIRKWTVKENMGQRVPLYVGLVLADARGDAMYAEIPQEIIHTLDPLLEVDNTYVISKFRVNPAKACYKPFSGHLMIEFTEFTSIKLSENVPPTFPKYIYALTSFDKIVPAQGPVPILTDILGYITKYTSATSVTPKGKERTSILREIFVKDMSDNELKITLWGDHAINFTIDHLNNQENPKAVIALFVGFIPRKWHSHYAEHKPYLSGSSGSNYYLNPDIQEALPFYKRFKDEPMYIERPPPSEDNISAQPQDTPLAEKTVAELNAIDPYEFPDEGYKCTVTVTHIPDNISWWYMSCKPCKKKMDPQAAGGYRCPKCYGTNALPRYLLNFFAEDETAEASFFAYDDVAKLMVLKDCDLILNPLKVASGLSLPLQSIISKKFTFSINLTEDSFSTRSKRQYLTSIQIPDTPQINQEVLQIAGTSESTPAPIIDSEKTPTKDHKNESSVPVTTARKRLFEEENVIDKESTGAQDLDAQTAGGDNLMDLTDPPPPAKTKRPKYKAPK
ncbi:replication protein A 70 kDa DNA-binding subunit isoform X3 [Sorghum bicolor]|uniref:replication protein A 70 kDa DNA-binding subunit isoform X3 n=1 Tax=Sorghum bicolor TaxID=4558 RepID=UPI000B4249EE|nr:replication protein A 70 kDa DNA-binding subunit isoform X3 [Sorghum bicolor]|eukprot:XP_002437143.2 replication protein A 70 kDa DNA-binding subunit isoform X3 [Sorghum bicolor]